MQVHPKNKLYDREIKMYFYLAKVGYIMPNGVICPCPGAINMYLTNLSETTLLIKTKFYVWCLLGKAKQKCITMAQVTRPNWLTYP